MLAYHQYLRCREGSSTERLTAPLRLREDRMVTITNDKGTMMIEQALVYAAKYRALALRESDQLMARLFDENAHWLETTAARLKHTRNLLNDVRA